MSMTNPVFCAIDRPDLAGALDLGRSLVGHVGGLKLGLEFMSANGPQGVRAIGEVGLPLFLDTKFHDIPNTVGAAVRAISTLEPALLTLHIAGGRAMVEAARNAVQGLAKRPRLLGITVLTSLDQSDLEATGISHSMSDQVLQMAELGIGAGLDGLVCAAHEVQMLRQHFGRGILLVVPGIRPNGAAVGDQKRTIGPTEAIARGADILVIGRPITQSTIPSEAAHAIAKELRQAA